MSNIFSDLSKQAGRVELAPQQLEARTKIEQWYEQTKKGGPREFKLGGYAGSGKTTLIKNLLTEAKLGYHTDVCAFTGKAADVLTRKGINASTIHSLIYVPDVDPATKEVHWVLRSMYDMQASLIIVDEASMVSTDLYNDLRSFNIPILFVGDPGQLEPVGDNPNLMKQPDFTLTEIHRQALESPIIGLATEIRKRGANYNPVMFGRKPPALNFSNKVLPGALLHSVDQIICARNKTRTQVNNKYRADKGYSVHDGLHEGEKLICLKNNRELGVFNGQILWLDKIKEERPLYYECTVHADGSTKSFTLPIWSDPFYRDLTEDELKRPPIPHGAAWCDFGYCITCHKSQGSEWDHVLVVDEWMGRVWDMGRWRYTAVTRAAKQLTYAI